MGHFIFGGWAGGWKPNAGLRDLYDRFEHDTPKVHTHPLLFTHVEFPI